MDKVYKVLEELGIQYEKVEHPELYTAEDGKKYNLKFNGVVCKNLFIRNKNKSNYYLISLYKHSNSIICTNWNRKDIKTL